MANVQKSESESELESVEGEEGESVVSERESVSWAPRTPRNTGEDLGDREEDRDKRTHFGTHRIKDTCRAASLIW